MKHSLDQKVEKFFEREFNAKVGKLILYDEDRNFLIFGKYIIKKLHQDFQIIHKTTATTKTFSKLKNAVSWCIFDNKNMITTAQRLEKLDEELSGLETVINLHQNLLKSKKNTEYKLIYLAKLSEEKLKKTLLEKELKTFLQQSDAFQKQNFV